MAAATTWTVSPGGASATTATGHLADTSTGKLLRCPDQSLHVHLKSGSGLAGTIGQVTFFGACSLRPVGDTADWKIRAVSYDASSGVTTGRITGVIMVGSFHGCSFNVASRTSGEPGNLNFRYANQGSALSLSGTPSLHFYGISGNCPSILGLSNGDPAAFHGVWDLSPSQAITSP
jgi:hypothetical protein